MKVSGTAVNLFCALALAFGEEEIEVNSIGCPLNFTIHKVLPHDTYCNLFYNCLRGERVEQRCPGELLFNSANAVCDWSINVDCGGKKTLEIESESEEDKVSPGGHGDPGAVLEICSKQGSDGTLVAHENCNEFYVCERGGAVVLQCPEGLLYNYKEGVCDWDRNVECGERIAPAPVVVLPHSDTNSPSVDVYEACAKAGSNGLLLPHEYCNRFYKCSFGLPVAISCPSGLVYNIEMTYCDWKEHVNCLGKPIVDEEKVEEDKDTDDGNDNESVNGGHGHSDPSKAPAICAAEKSDGVLVAHEICNQFYKCSQGIPVEIDCPLNLLYNPEIEACDWPRNVECGTRVKHFKRR